ncbi:MAG TPA: LuxR C-terminal-related transcriptional regulator [Pseudonocardiaceae bacterium]|nr:LuxR C-terminal-related transcriptional regulator [Pseudonocardiaceae bacterium]
MSADPVSTADTSLRYVLDRLADGPHRAQTVSAAVLRSWRRSAEAGLIPRDIHAPYDPDVDVDGRLHWAAAPGMAAVCADLPDVEAALLLADGRGHVIARWASSHTATVMDRIGAAPGFVCEEAVVGTNSIGSAIRTGDLSVVLGWQHFADSLTGVSCASRPVNDPVTGQLLGVVNVTCQPREYSRMLPALIGRIVHETRQRLVGDHVPVDAATRWAMLTASERGVAAHVADGLTNRETASALFISVHTVDFHLRQIFRKLDLRSRVELARLVADVEHR